MRERPANLDRPYLCDPELVVGASGQMRAIAQLVERVAPARATVLIRGESGTGKELIARALHRKSQVASPTSRNIIAVRRRLAIASPR